MTETETIPDAYANALRYADEFFESSFGSHDAAKYLNSVLNGLYLEFKLSDLPPAKYMQRYHDVVTAVSSGKRAVEEERLQQLFIDVTRVRVFHNHTHRRKRQRVRAGRCKRQRPPRWERRMARQQRIMTEWSVLPSPLQDVIGIPPPGRDIPQLNL